MDRHTIRTSATDSVKGLPSTNSVDVNLKQTAKTLPFPNVSTTLSQRGVYEEERQAGNKFRLILTVVPYCTNVLFNPLTEIIKDEGSINVSVVTDKNTASIGTDAIGNPNPTRVQMISNTEYSSELHGGYEYHPGYDFFDNHLLRNLSFKVVNPRLSTSDPKVFNTLEDYMRDRNGEIKKFAKRTSIASLNGQDFDRNKHLYLHDDILPIEDSINQNLYEDNGWWGFTNNTSIDPKILEHRKWYSLDIGKAINNKKPCEFIDMYPDRTLFSFSPKFNKYTHENEYNWNVVLTYPYKNIYDHPICLGGSSYIKRHINSNGDVVEESISEGNRWMGLKIMDVKLGSGKIGSNTLIFRTYTKHGLKQGEMFYLYYTNPYSDTKHTDYRDCDKFSTKTLNGQETYYESESYHKVTNTGDLSRNNDDYYFYTSDMSLLKEIYKSYLLYVERIIKKNGNSNLEEEIPFYDLYKNDDKKDIYNANNELKVELLSKLLRYTNFRFRRCVNGVKSTYYIRQFRQIPNLRAASREMTNEESSHMAKFNGLFEKYIKDNALDPTNPKYQRTFNNEAYQLGFASSIYNDNISQFTFTDGIDVKGLTDNLGRPLSEIYYTVVKNNAGYEVWYDKTNPKYYTNADIKKQYGNDYKVEFSHCFGKVTSGFEMHIEKNDDEKSTAPIEYWKKLSSVNHIANISNNGGFISEDRDSFNLDNDVKYRNSFFYGDLTEFNPFDFKETQISKVMHRFNTAQRETINNPQYSQYQFHEIITDDFDRDEFKVMEFSAVTGVSLYKEDSGMSITDYQTISRPEGYYYQAHYPIKIREYTRIQQDSHQTIRVRNAKPVQKDGILIQVTTTMPHNLNQNDIIFVCDDSADIRYVTKCISIIDRFNFLMSPHYEEIVVNATDFEDSLTISNIKQHTSKDKDRYKDKFSWLELCEILNGKYQDDVTYPSLVLRRKNKDIPDYATYIGRNKYLWRDLVNIGDSQSKELDDYIFANGYFYVTQSINFYLKRQDPFGVTGLYFDGSGKYPYFPNDPSGVIQEENNYLTKDTSVSC